jgi:hypothetical protein
MNDTTPDSNATRNTLIQLPPPGNPSTIAINHVSETDIDPALLHATCIPTQTPSGERIPKEQFFFFFFFLNLRINVPQVN